MKLKNQFFIFLCCILTFNIGYSQCNATHLKSNKGGIISCNFPALHPKDLDFYKARLETAAAENWELKRTEQNQRRAQQWNTKNLRVLILANNDDLLSENQLQELKLAMNLHLVDIAKAYNNELLHWSQVPVVEEIFIETYPEEFLETFGSIGFLVFSDPDPRNGETPLTEFVTELIDKHSINTLINLVDTELDIPFKGSAQVYCSDPGEFMSVSIKKNNTIALSNKYLVQFALACVHTIGHTNFANHQEAFKFKEESNHCNEDNFAFANGVETTMCNVEEGIKVRANTSSTFGEKWSKDNANKIIDTYMQRGLLVPAFEFQAEKPGDEEIVENNISLFPNPVDQILTIELEQEVKYQMSVYNSAGDLIQKQQLESFITELDLSSFVSGMYIFEFFCEGTGERVIKKVEKIH